MAGYWSGPDNEVWTSTSNWWTNPSGPPTVPSVPGTSAGETAVFYAYGVSQDTTYTVYFGSGPANPVFLQLGNNRAHQQHQGLILKGGTSTASSPYTFNYAPDAGVDFSISIGNSYGGLTFDSTVSITGTGKLSVYADPAFVGVPSPVHFYGSVTSDTGVECTGIEAHFYNTLTTPALYLIRPENGQDKSLASIHIEPTATFPSTVQVILGIDTTLYFKKTAVFTANTVFMGNGTVCITANQTLILQSVACFPTRDTTLRLVGATVVFNPGGDISKNFFSNSFQNGPLGEYCTFDTNGNNINLGYHFANAVPFGLRKVGVGTLALPLGDIDNSLSEVVVQEGSIAPYGDTTTYSYGTTTSITLANSAGVEITFPYSNSSRYIHNLTGGGIYGGNILFLGQLRFAVTLTASRNNTYNGRVVSQTTYSNYLYIDYSTVQWDVTSYTLTLTSRNFHPYVVLQAGILKMGTDWVFEDTSTRNNLLFSTINYHGYIKECTVDLNNTQQHIDECYAVGASAAPYSMKFDFKTNSSLTTWFSGSYTFSAALVGNGTWEARGISKVANPQSTLTGTIKLRGDMVVSGAQYTDHGVLGDLRNMALEFAGGSLMFRDANTLYSYDYSANFSPNSTRNFKVYATTNGLLTLASPIAGTVGLEIYAGTTYVDNSYGQLRLLGNNTYAGDTYISKATVSVGTNSPFGTGTVHLSKSTIYQTIDYNAGIKSSSTTERIISNNMSINSQGTYAEFNYSTNTWMYIPDGTTVTIQLGDSVDTGRLVFTGNVIFEDAQKSYVTFASDVVFSGTVTRTDGGSHLLYKQGVGTLTLVGDGTSYGSYQVEQGTLCLATTTALGSGDVFVQSSLKTLTTKTRINGRLTIFSGASLVVG